MRGALLDPVPRGCAGEWLAVKSVCPGYGVRGLGERIEGPEDS